MVQVTIVSRHECEPCEAVLAIAHSLQARIPFQVNYLDIEGNLHLLEQYGDRVPVVLIDEVETFSGKFSEQELARAIKRARWRKPISRILSRLGVGPTRG